MLWARSEPIVTLTLLTRQNSKEFGFDTVVLGGLKDDKENLEREWRSGQEVRLLYVEMTRARQQFLTGSGRDGFFEKVLNEWGISDSCVAVWLQ